MRLNFSICRVFFKYKASHFWAHLLTTEALSSSPTPEIKSQKLPFSKSYPKKFSLRSISEFMVRICCSSEERKPSIQEIASQKGIVQRANGWRVQHIAGQMDELVRGKLGRESPVDHWNFNLTSHFHTFQISAEQEVLKKMGELREKIPKVKPGQKTKFQDDLVMLNELLQVRISNNGTVCQF